MKSVSLLLLVPVMAAAACVQSEKSENPLSPTVAGPIPGVSISMPDVIEPKDGQRIAVDRQPVTLVVANAETNGVRPLKYMFEVALDADFTNKVLVREGVEPGDGRTELRMPDALAPERTYYWRARSQDGANTGPFTGFAFFSVYTPVVIGRPILQQPTNNERIDSVVPEFAMANASRSGPAGAIAYEIELATNAAFANISALWTVAEQPNTTRLRATALAADTQYFWRARAFDGSVAGPWSDTHAFRTAIVVVAPPPFPGPGGPAQPCGPPYPNNGPAVVNCVMARYPERLVAGVSLSKRMENMSFLRDRVIETGICGGMDLAWNTKRGDPRQGLSIDAIVHRQNGGDTLMDIGFAYDDTSRPLRLGWTVSIAPFYRAYPRPSC
jgi:hypothetical protein